MANQEDWNKPICIWSEGVNAFENSGRIEYASSGDYLVNYSPETAQVLDSATGSVVQTLYSQPNRCQQDPSGNLFRHAFTPVELQIPEFSDAFALLDGNGILRFYGKPRQSAKFRFLYAQTGYSLDPLCPFACEGEPGFESAQNGRNWIMSNQNSASHLFYSSQNDALYVANTCGLSKIDMVSIRKQIRLFIQSIRTGRDFNDYYKMASKAASAPEL